MKAIIFSTIFIIAYIPASGGWCQSTNNFREPSEKELKAIYCLKISQFIESYVTSGILKIPKEILDNMNNMSVNDPNYRLARSILDIQTTAINNRKRLQAYLLPRLFDIDPIYILEADNRAAEDIKLVQSQARVAPCSYTEGKSSPQCAIENKEISESIKPIPRVAACQDLSFLPF